MEGFIVFDHVKNYAPARKQLAQWLAEGKLKRQETIVKGGLKVAEQALVDLFKGGNTGEKHSSGAWTASIALIMSRQTTCRSQVSRDDEQAVIARAWTSVDGFLTRSKGSSSCSYGSDSSTVPQRHRARVKGLADQRPSNGSLAGRAGRYPSYPLDRSKSYDCSRYTTYLPIATK